jgi:hypothetical protein
MRQREGEVWRGGGLDQIELCTEASSLEKTLAPEMTSHRPVT